MEEIDPILPPLRNLQLRLRHRNILYVYKQKNTIYIYKNPHIHIYLSIYLSIHPTYIFIAPNRNKRVHSIR